MVAIIDIASLLIVAIFIITKLYFIIILQAPHLKNQSS